MANGDGDQLFVIFAIGAGILITIFGFEAIFTL